MRAKNTNSPRLQNAYILLVIVLSLLLHFAIFFCSKYFCRNWIGFFEPGHSAIEMSGAIMAFFIAVTLYILEKQGKGTSYNIRIASALFSMGVLDAAHASAPFGNIFVWLHSMATVAGGFCMATVWIPIQLELKQGLRLFCFVIISSFVLVILSFTSTQWIPDMLNSGFTGAAKLSHTLGGIFFILASIRLLMAYRLNNRADDLIFAVHSILFALAALTFLFSEPWDSMFWGWHVLRLFAYAVASGFILLRHVEVEQELSQTNITLARAVKRLASTNAELKQYAYVASHDLQAPLRVVMNWAQMLDSLLPVQRSEKLDQAVEIITDNAKKANTLVGDILKLAQVSISNEDVKLVDLNEIVRAIIGQLESTNPECKDSITCAHLPKVWGVASYLESVFKNLLQNAIKYREAKRALRVEISCEAFPSEYLFRVKDNGIGIAKEEQNKVFLMFTRSYRETIPNGTGIGLALCKKIVELSDGQIWLESIKGEGSTFYFTYPKHPNFKLSLV